MKLEVPGRSSNEHPCQYLCNFKGVFLCDMYLIQFSRRLDLNPAVVAVSIVS